MLPKLSGLFDPLKLLCSTQSSFSWFNFCFRQRTLSYSFNAWDLQVTASRFHCLPLFWKATSINRWIYQSRFHSDSTWGISEKITKSFSSWQWERKHSKILHRKKSETTSYIISLFLLNQKIDLLENVVFIGDKLKDDNGRGSKHFWVDKSTFVFMLRHNMCFPLCSIIWTYDQHGTFRTPGLFLTCFDSLWNVWCLSVIFHTYQSKGCD